MTLLYWGEDDERGQRWAQLFSEHAPEFEFRHRSDMDDPAAVEYLLAWKPPSDLVARFPNLRAVFATSAGVDQFDFAAIPASIPVVRMFDPQIHAGVVEYATFATLYLHRDIDRYRCQQAESRWQPWLPKAAADRSVGILGLGALGRAVAERLMALGFSVSGWARSPHKHDGVACFHGPNGLARMLANTDILICLLPLTDATHGLLGMDLFRQMSHGAALVNMGRGGHLVENDLCRALDDGQLRAAVLDVFDTEPLPANHPFWHDERILITPHIAAMTNPDTAFAVLVDNLRRHRSGEPMTGTVDRGRGY